MFLTHGKHLESDLCRMRCKDQLLSQISNPSWAARRQFSSCKRFDWHLNLQVLDYPAIHMDLTQSFTWHPVSLIQSSLSHLSNYFKAVAFS